MRTIFSLFICLLFGGCATPVGYTEKPMQRADKDTTYRVDDHEDGFTITVYYSRYQFIPESDAVSTAGKSALLSTAYEVAEARGKKIQPINEQRIKMSMGRNGVSGTTSWSGTVRVFYEKKTEPNQSPEPTRPSVTDRADARSAPAGRAAHL